MGSGLINSNNTKLIMKSQALKWAFFEGFLESYFLKERIYLTKHLFADAKFRKDITKKVFIGNFTGNAS